MQCSIMYSPLRQALIFLVFERLKAFALRGQPAGTPAAVGQLFELQQLGWQLKKRQMGRRLLQLRVRRL